MSAPKLEPELVERLAPRFELERPLGRGGFGSVFAAHDRQRGMAVALKTLRAHDGDALAALRREFRALQQVVHPNLLTPYELVVQHGLPVLTMELVEGTTFLRSVRGGELDTLRPALPSTRPVRFDTPAPVYSKTVSRAGREAGPRGELFPPPVQPLPESELPRLRQLLGELVDALEVLHRARHVHGDVTPSNVLVDVHGCLRLVDFGLSTRPKQAGGFAGTPAYAAPEQLSGRILPASDWYAVGVLLYEALTGSRPFSGDALQVLVHKQNLPAPDPRTAVGGEMLPDDLVELALALLDSEPERRPEAADIRGRLGTETDRFGVETLCAGLVGRSIELDALRAAWRQSLDGTPRTVCIVGASGTGKTALAERFVEHVRRELPAARVLTGRCYEREGVPFKALDEIVAGLSKAGEQALRGLDPTSRTALARVFPGCVDAPDAGRTDERELLGLAASGLRQLTLALLDEAPLLWLIDDVQWADADSVRLLLEALGRPLTGGPDERLPLMLLLTCRGDRAPEALASLPPHVIELQSLAARDAETLAAELIGARGEAAARVAREAGGHPLLIRELAHHASQFVGERGSFTLEAALAARASRLSRDEHAMLRLLTLAEGPLPTSVLGHAAGMELARAERIATLLESRHWARSQWSATRGTSLELYHDRVRQALRPTLSPELQRRLHARLADAIAFVGLSRDEPASALWHLQGAGRTPEAARVAERAAAVAMRQLAFDRAQELLRTALELGDPADPGRRRLKQRHAEALACAGNGPAAGEAYLAAAEGAPTAEALYCRRRAGELWLISGYVERGLDILEQLLREAQGPRTRGRGGALRALVRERMQLRLRGLGFTPASGAPDGERRERVEVARSVAFGMALVDTIRAAEHSTRSLRLALDEGDPVQVARCLAAEAVFVASERAPSRRADALLAHSRRAVAMQPGSAWASAWADGAQAAVHVLSGRVEGVDARCAEAEERFRTRVPDSIWEQTTLQLFRCMALRLRGHYGQLGELMPQLLRQAAWRQNRYLQTTLQRGGNGVWLARDEPGRAAEELARTRWTDLDRGFHLQHWFELEAEGERGLYVGCFEGIRSRHAPRLARMRGSLLMYLRLCRCMYLWLDGRLRLAEASVAPSRRARLAARTAVLGSAALLDLEKVDVARCWAGLLRATVWASGGWPAAPRVRHLLRGVQLRAEGAGLELPAAMAARHLALWSGDRAALGQADASLQAIGICSPERMSRVTAPGLAPP